MNLTPTGERAKTLGAFYTDRAVADFLVAWALRSPHDHALDPSFGGGVFLEAAAERLEHLGGDARSLYGAELDPEVYAHVSSSLAARGLPPQNLSQANFFDVDAGTGLLPLDAVIGNPPFIRYQKFSGDVRSRALARAEAQGVLLSGRSSAWAPFLVHSISLLKPGGRLGMVVPIELGHAGYARPVLRHLTESFGSITLLTFREPLFPHLSQDTLLVLAEGRGAAFKGLFWRDVESVRALEPSSTFLQKISRLDTPALLNGKDKLVSYFLSPDARELYRELGSSGRVKRLGELAEVGIGYVTGANKFFHLGKEDVASWNIPQNFLRRAVFRGGAFQSVRFGCEDWAEGAKNGDAGYLLDLSVHPPEDPLPEGVRRYLEHGEAAGVHRAYKCRIRSPWYVVPHVHEADAFLTYMSGSRPQLVTNDAGAVAPNTLHVVRLRPHSPVSKNMLSALWLSSLTSLSVELEGHALGGGLLKLEPTEARRVLVALPSHGDLAELTEELDALLRKGEGRAARGRADEVVLQGALKLSARECESLREAARTLRARRCK